LTKEENNLIEYIRNKGKCNIDLMAFDLNTDPGTLALRLLELEFGGYVRSLPGKSYELV
jgi:DNA processing protein